MGAPSGVSEKQAATSTKQDMIFTKAPLFRRAKDECPQNYSLCPVSSNGGCCPTGHSCGTSSCYATTPTPLSVCSELGYSVCGIAEGGGCCPGGYKCASNSCIPTTKSITTTCTTGQYMCPESFGYGCCHTGKACGVGYCYDTTFPTVNVTVVTTTTDSKSRIKTVTSVIETAYVPSSAPTLQPSPSATAAIARYTPTEVPVAKVVSTPGSSSGLSTGALAGVVVAAVVILIAIIATGWCLMRRINAVAKQSQGHRTSGSDSNRTPMSHNNGRGGPNGGGRLNQANVDYDNMSIDPLMMAASGTATPRLPRPSPTYGSSYDTQTPALSPPIPSPYDSTVANPQGYQPVPVAEAQYFDTIHHHSGQGSPNNIVSPYSPAYPSPAPWGDMSAAPAAVDPALRDQNLRFGRQSVQSVQSNRHWSQISDMTVLSTAGSGIAELDARGGVAELAEPEVAATGLAAIGRSGSRPSGESHRKSRSFEFKVHRRQRSSTGSGASQLLTPPLPGQSPILENEAETEVEQKGGSRRGHRITRSDEGRREEQIQYVHQVERNSLPTPIVTVSDVVASNLSSPDGARLVGGDEATGAVVPGLSRKPLQNTLVPDSR